MHSDNPEDYELAHHGTKGMKWGVRRKDGPDGTVPMERSLEGLGLKIEPSNLELRS